MYHNAGESQNGEDDMEWWKDILAALVAADVRQVGYVPDAGHTALINACIAYERMRTVALTTEEEGIALVAGAWLGGARGVLLMQSSGVGNCINMLSLAQACAFPLAMFVTMRGQYKEFNPWQEPMGRSSRAHLETAGLKVLQAEQPGDVAGMAQTVLDEAFGNCGRAALLLHQQLMPVKTFGK